MGSVREEIAKNLLYYRKNKKHTQKELADYLGVNNSAVSNWEKGLNSIDIDTLHRACVFLGVSVNDMFGSFANVNNTNLSSDEVEVIEAYRLLDQRGKNAVCYTLEQEGKYIQEAYLAEREHYIKNNSLPFAAAGGDSSNLDEAQELYDKSRSKHNPDGK